MDRVIMKVGGVTGTMSHDSDYKYRTGLYRTPAGGLHVVWRAALEYEVIGDLSTAILHHTDSDADVFFRATNNPNEQDIISTLKSKNWADDAMENGLSVSQSPAYMVFQGYKYIYKVTGDVIGTGSDGEPLLANAKPMSDMMQEIPPEWRREIEERHRMKLSEIGLTPNEALEIYSRGMRWVDAPMPDDSRLIFEPTQDSMYELHHDIYRGPREAEAVKKSMAPNPLRMTRDYLERVKKDEQHPDPYYEQSSKNRVLPTSGDFADEEIHDNDAYHETERMFQSR